MADPEFVKKFFENLQAVTKEAIVEWKQARFGENHIALVELETMFMV